MPPVRRDPNRVERRIYFYRADVGAAPDGSLLPFDPVPVLRRIERLAFRPDARYLPTDDRTLCCWPETAGRPRLMLANIRHQGLPRVEVGMTRRVPVSVATRTVVRGV